MSRDMLPKPDAVMCAKFLRAHAAYLNIVEGRHPYVNSARAISEVNEAAADFLEGSGVVAKSAKLSKMFLALTGIVGHWEKNGGVVEREFIDRAIAAMRGD